MLIVQHIWSRWTKAARGANAPLKRLRLDEAYLLPAIEGADSEAWRHEIRAIEEEDFAVIERAGPISRDEWQRSLPWREAPLDWRLRNSAAEISLRRPSDYRQQTRWPTRLPSPLFVLGPGETARIDWNGRFRMSTFGSNRSSYYEQHIYWLAFADGPAPAPRLFLDAAPRKHVDLRTGIY